MTAARQTIAFTSPLTVYCRSIAAPMTRYWRFWRTANVPPFRKLRSDYPLSFISCNCLRRCRCAHVHRLLMKNRIAASGARSKTATRVLGFHWHKENHALCPRALAARSDSFARRCLCMSAISEIAARLLNRQPLS